MVLAFNGYILQHILDCITPRLRQGSVCIALLPGGRFPANTLECICFCCIAQSTQHSIDVRLLYRFSFSNLQKPTYELSSFNISLKGPYGISKFRRVDSDKFRFQMFLSGFWVHGDSELVI